MATGVTTSETTGVGSKSDEYFEEVEKEKEEVVEVKEKPKIEEKMSDVIKEQGTFGMYLGYKIVEDNGIDELRLPKDVIGFLANFADWSKIDKKFLNAELVPNKFYVCFKCGFKRQKIKGTQSSMFLCPKCHKPLGAP